MRTHIKQTINGKTYNTETATVIASDEYWDGNNWERHFTNTHLYKTKNGAYFVGHSTQWQGSRDCIEAVSKSGAKAWYEELPEHEQEWAIAFDEAEVEA